MKPHKISTHLAYSDNCYFHHFYRLSDELKFCKVSRNSISNWTWEFQLSILKNKKVLFLKQYFLGCSLSYAKIVPKDGTCCPNFQWSFWTSAFRLCSEAVNICGSVTSHSAFGKNLLSPDFLFCFTKKQLSRYLKFLGIS